MPNFFKALVSRRKKKGRTRAPAKLPSSNPPLPPEIFLDIFNLLRPPFYVPELGLLFQTYHEYMFNLSRLASLRVVCRFWNQILLPIIHREVVIPTLSLYKAKRAIRFLNHCHAHHIRSLVFCDLQGRYWTPREHIAQIQLLFTKELKSKVADADIKHLGCYSKVMDVLSDAQWLGALLPRVPSTIESLTLNYIQQDKMFLKQMGASIKTLEIQHWYADSPRSNELPDEMPLLTRMVISDGGPWVEDIFQLFRCVGAIDRGSSTPSVSHSKERTVTARPLTSNLQSLVLEHLSVLHVDHIVTILQTNSIGKSLTSLTVEPSILQGWCSQGGTRILLECPSLISFRYTPPVDKTFFDALPPTLRHLSLFMYPANFDAMHNIYLDGCLISPLQFIQFLHLPQCTLHTLTVLLRKPYSHKDEPNRELDAEVLMKRELELACTMARVFLRWVCVDL